ncbi:MAG: PilZ domain-containing protein [Candidatus Omnitrophota bacterium]
MTWEGLNRRQFPRANFPCLIKILREGQGDEAILTHTENISTGGSSVIIKKSLDLFLQVKVEVDLMDGGDLITTDAKVVWVVRRKAVEAQKPSFYDVGLEFLNLGEAARARVARTVEHLVRFGRQTPMR